MAATIDSQSGRTRVIVTTDAEIDDECSMVRFLLYTNEWDVEAIISTSSQYHAHDHKWAGDNWLTPYLDAYENVYQNLCKHDNRYPSPDYLRSISMLGNVATEGEMSIDTEGSQRIVELLLDKTDSRPIWIQAWGGTNTIAKALKTIEENFPDRMSEVATKIRFYFIWEQDECYQQYIRPRWGKYNIPTIISDQFIAYFYHWKKYIPQHEQNFMNGSWMNHNILTSHGQLCSLYKAHENGDFRSEGDSPAFFYLIPTGLESPENPDYGGWGGRFVNIRENIWLDPVPETDYVYPDGRWYTKSAWGRMQLSKAIENDSLLRAYLKPMWRWIEPLQNDFAARADWCVKSYKDANHAPIVILNSNKCFEVSPGEIIKLNVAKSYDPDNDSLSYYWWQYHEADRYTGTIEIKNSDKKKITIEIPADAQTGENIHLICNVSDDGTPSLTRYCRVIMTIK